MKEILDYLATLRTRGGGVAFRELRSRFIRGPVKTAVRRVMDVCERHDTVFTFFITGNCAIMNRSFMEEIIDRGHEISCHGYEHLRFDMTPRDEAIADLLLAKKLFKNLFSYDLNGFRAPYLGMNEDVAAVLKEVGLKYSSSVMAYAHESKTRFEYPNGLPEFPIVACDWHSLIRDNVGGKAFLDEMVGKIENNAVFELHPWRMGQKPNIWILEKLLEQCSLPSVSMAELAQGKDGFAMTGDLGELALTEIFQRLIPGLAPSREKVEREMEAYAK